MAGMKKGTKQILLIGGLGVGGYFAYSWWQGRQAAAAEEVGYWPTQYAGSGAGGGGFSMGLLGDCGPGNLGVPEQGVPMYTYPSMPEDLVAPPGETRTSWWLAAVDAAEREKAAGGLREPVAERAATLWDRIRIGAVTRETARAGAIQRSAAVTALTRAQVAAYKAWGTPRDTAYTVGVQPWLGLTGYPKSVTTPAMAVARKEAAKSRLAFQMKRGLGAPTLPVGESLAAKRAVGAITRETARAAARQRAVAVTTLGQARVAEYQAAAATVKPTAYTVGRQPYVGLTGYPRSPTVSPVVTQQIKEQRLAAAMRNI